MQAMKDSASDEDFEPDMPEAGAAEYLLGHFWAVGPTLGDEALTDTELRNHQENMGTPFSPWECKILKRLSREYLAESHRATRRDCKPPFDESTDAVRLQQAELDRKLDAFLD
jgi:hypothetical protein